MKKTNDNEFLPSFGKTENGKCIEIKEPFIHLVYYKWQTQPDNTVSYNLCIKKGGGDLDSEYSGKRSELSDLRREKLKILNQLNSTIKSNRITLKKSKRALKGTPDGHSRK
ncbi:MAG: hypothetical protein Q7W54_04890 [Bacteroidota bacterium]|nr:hypothetical protein [Bacteroidota bacterium]